MKSYISYYNLSTFEIDIIEILMKMKDDILSFLHFLAKEYFWKLNFPIKKKLSYNGQMDGNTDGQTDREGKIASRL